MTDKTSHLNWVWQSNSERGSIAKIELFRVKYGGKYKTILNDPIWVMSTTLPGFPRAVWKHDDLDHLKEQAEEFLMNWGRRIFPELSEASKEQENGE